MTPLHDPFHQISKDGRVGSNVSKQRHHKCEPPFVCFSVNAFFFSILWSLDINLRVLLCISSRPSRHRCHVYINPRAHSILIKNSVSEGNNFSVVFMETSFLMSISISQDLKSCSRIYLIMSYPVVRLSHQLLVPL